MLSDETSFSERTGRPHRGQLHVRNPQIINGGQTAYTLSHIYEQAVAEERVDEVFRSKEVMLKVITLVDSEVDDRNRLALIEAISKATNQQTTVVEADRRSNDLVQIELQERIYREFGYFYERKKGEFFDGLRNDYVTRVHIVDREVLLRVALALSNPEAARRSSTKVLFSKENFDATLDDSSRYDEFFFAYRAYEHLEAIQANFKRDRKNRFGVVNYGNALRYGKLAVIYVARRRLRVAIQGSDVESLARTSVDDALAKWLEFEDFARRRSTNREYFRKIVDPSTGEEVLETNFDGYYKVHNVRRDLNKFFRLGTTGAPRTVRSSA